MASLQNEEGHGCVRVECEWFLLSDGVCVQRLYFVAECVNKKIDGEEQCLVAWKIKVRKFTKKPHGPLSKFLYCINLY